MAENENANGHADKRTLGTLDIPIGGIAMTIWMGPDHLVSTHFHQEMELSVAQMMLDEAQRFLDFQRHRIQTRVITQEIQQEQKALLLAQNLRSGLRV